MHSSLGTCAARLLLVLTILSSFLGCGIDESVVRDEEVKQAWADVEAAYQRRANLIPNLVAVVKASADFEKGTLTAVMEARAAATQTKLSFDGAGDEAKLKAFVAAQQQLGASLGRLMVVAEQYPQLKSTQLFSDLMTQVEGSENRIQTEIRKYNRAVSAYNQTVRKVMTAGGSAARGLKVRPTFQASEGADQAPTIDFGGTK